MQISNGLQAGTASALLAVLFAVGPVASPALAAQELSSSAWSQKPLVSPSPAVPVKSDDDWLVANHRQENLETRYGADRDIAAPPMLVKKSATNSSTYVTQPIRISHSSVSGHVLDQPVPPGMLPHAFNATRNQPVIQTISRHGYASPAQEFAARAYLGMGMLALVAVVLGGVVLVRYRSRGNALDDFDLFDQPPGQQ